MDPQQAGQSQTGQLGADSQHTDRLNHNARYLVVKNEALSERFDNYERSATRTRLMEELDAKEIIMPKLYDWIVADLNRHDLTVSAGINNPAFDFFNRQRLLNWQHLLYSRSEEHTSELQSRQYLVCRLLL